MKRTSAVEHLARLPDVFDMGQFSLSAGVTPASAKVMLSRWASQGLIAHAGPQAGIYYKRLGEKWSADDQTACAILTLYPAAVVCGASVLHAHGWTTQIPRSIHIHVPTQSRNIQIHGVSMTKRPMSWYETLHEHQTTALSNNDEPGEHHAGPWGALRKLSPAWALADLVARAEEGGNEWLPDPDDIDIPPESINECLHASAALGIPADVMSSYITQSQQHHDYLEPNASPCMDY